LEVGFCLRGCFLWLLLIFVVGWGGAGEGPVGEVGDRREVLVFWETG
jgi:hypothetical protein